MQTRKFQLEIHYQLFTNQNPEKKRVGPFNGDRVLYCDLINIICNEERDEIREDMTVELYTCEGYPLATRPISYISKLSDWCLEEYPDTPLLYAVPRLKCYTDKCTQYMTAAPLCDGIDHIFIRNAECDFKRTIRTNCNEATYFQLMKTIQDMTGIPGHLIQLYQADKQAHSDEDSLTLDKLSIGNQSALDMKLNDHFWTLGKDKNFSLQECKPTWHQEQSNFGTSFFFSCLYSLADWMAEPDQRSSGVFYKTLGHIRSITGCPPLIHALNIMFRNETLSLPHRVAIQECLVMLFKTIEPKNRKLHIPGFEIINTKKVTEFSNYFWVYLIHYSNKSHLQTEQYSTLNLTCSVTFKRMTDPVLVMDTNGVEHIVDRNTLYREDRDLVKYLYNYKRMIHSFIGDEVIIWNCIHAPTCGVDLTDKWEGLTELCSSFPALSVQTPLNINALCRKPSMVPLANGNIGVYTSTSVSKIGDRPFIYFEVSTGKYNNFDVQELDRAVKSNPPPIWEIIDHSKHALQTMTRDPEEIIMVILDTSASMTSLYLDCKTKVDSVLEAFLAFCDRTEAYQFKNMIGLILFAQDCLLQYPFSEDLQGFTDQFGTYPIGTSTAIYDAIKFAVDQFENFTTQYPNCRDVHRRILCLTDGADNNSSITPKRATRLLVDNGIIMDCVLLCPSITVDTHAIAKASGGYSFKPFSSREMLNIFEQETMLSMKWRKDCTAVFPPGKSIDLSSQATRPLDTEPTHVLPDKLNIKVQTIQKCLSRALIQKQLASRPNTNLTKRIIQELSYYQAHPHPAFEVFPGEEHIDFWRIIMEGPEGTPYEGGIFELFIEFINEYPAKPPNIRFITPIYHCNINSSGRICHTILDRFYAPGVRVGDIFNHVYGLLSSPEEQDPLDSVKANLLRFNKEKYFREAKYFTDYHAKVPITSVRIKLLGGKQNVKVNYPEHLVCPLTLQLFEDPVATLSGDTYEREAIVEHLNSGKNYDPFTFREIHINELRPNKLIQRSVFNYKQQVAMAAKL